MEYNPPQNGKDDLKYLVNKMPYVTHKDKEDDITHLREQIDRNLIYPALTAKFKSEVEPNLRAGVEDFIIINEQSTDFKNGKEMGSVFPHTAWGGAQAGFRILCSNIPDILETVSYVMDTTNLNKVYFVCESPDMGHPRINTVEETKQDYEITIAELRQPGEFVLDQFFDR